MRHTAPVSFSYHNGRVYFTYTEYYTRRDRPFYLSRRKQIVTLR